MIPARARPNCIACEAHSDAYFDRYRPCVVRHVARLSRIDRLRWLADAAVVHGPNAIAKFVDEVDAVRLSNSRRKSA